MDFRIHLLTCSLVTAISPLAHAQQASVVRAQTGRAIRVPFAAGLPGAIAELPPTTAVALHAPRLEDLLTDLETTTNIAAAFEPMLEERTWSEVTAEVLWGSGIGFVFPQARRPDIARWSTPEGLEALGFDLDAPVTVGLALDGVALIRASLAAPDKWQAWLRTARATDATRATIGASTVDVLAASSEFPVACHTGPRHLDCQIGAAPGEDPLRPLRRLLAPDSQSLGAHRGLERAYDALPTDGRLYGFVHTPAVASWLEDLAKTREARAHRFAHPSVRKRALDEAKHMIRKARHVAAKVEGTAFAVYKSKAGLDMRVESALSAYGTQHLAKFLRPYGEHAVVSRWADTPALAQIVLRTHPKTTQRLLQAIDVDLPQSTLTGDVALLTFGVDPETPLAKRHPHDADTDGHPSFVDHLSWAFLLPSAAAVGLAGPSAAEHVKKGLEAGLGTKSERHGKNHGCIRGRVQGSSYEIDVLDQVMLVGAGTGSGAAAMRRLRARTSKAARLKPPMLEASIDLHAIDAAFASGSFSGEHQPDLLAFEALRLRMKPLLDHVSRVELEARARVRSKRLSMRVAARQ